MSQPSVPIRQWVLFRAIEVSGGGGGAVLMRKRIGMSLPGHSQKSGMSPKLGSFHLRTGVAS